MIFNAPASTLCLVCAPAHIDSHFLYFKELGTLQPLPVLCLILPTFDRYLLLGLADILLSRLHLIYQILQFHPQNLLIPANLLLVRVQQIQTILPTPYCSLMSTILLQQFDILSDNPSASFCHPLTISSNYFSTYAYLLLII